MELTRTWGLLVGLSLGSTALAAAGSADHWALATILLLAWFKAHLILKHYLGLRRTPPILRGFDIVTGLVMMVMLGLGLAGTASVPGIDYQCCWSRYTDSMGH